MLLPALPGAVMRRTAGLSAIPGVLGLCGQWLLYQLMASEALNLVAPVRSLPAAATPIVFGMVDGQTPSAFTLIAQAGGESRLAPLAVSRVVALGRGWRRAVRACDVAGVASVGRRHCGDVAGHDGAADRRWLGRTRLSTLLLCRAG